MTSAVGSVFEDHFCREESLWIDAHLLRYASGELRGAMTTEKALKASEAAGIFG
jgi:hypothetical protein